MFCSFPLAGEGWDGEEKGEGGDPREPWQHSLCQTLLLLWLLGGPLALVTLIIRQETTAAFAQYEAAQRALDIYTQGVREVARQNLDVVRQTYTLGRTTLLDVIAEQRRYIDIETGYTEAWQQAYDAVVDIERAVGTLER